MKLPADVRQLLARRFDAMHRDWLADDAGAAGWPLDIALGAPTEAAALRQVEAVRAWVAAWGAWRGAGELRWCERQWKVLGTQRLPATLTVHGPEQAALWIGEQERWGRAARRRQVLAARWPVLARRLPRQFATLADYAEADFQRLLDMLAWIEANPRSGLYPRQLPVAGLDSKWLESRKGALLELVAAMRGAPADGADFYALCGLQKPPAQLRMRLLDPALRARLGGLGDVTAPVDELARLDLKPTLVLVVENLQTGLALADIPGALVFMALGYGVDLLAQLPWIAQARCLYWGDIDTHGYAILQRARGHLPQLRSVLMDEATLHRFAALWTDEKTPHPATTLTGLTPDEHAVYTGLKLHRWRHQLRLEQERIDWSVAWQALLAAAAH
ncbi:hypothetical protein ACFDR9_002726 [Janthinobacterium sp. CG_23.3]|uniref:DUF3322 domain-containing protein n=1 Tax=Janthinobacterium sp. CG_23.3 TaxID=3349634 RepID=UPI0038D4D907